MQLKRVPNGTWDRTTGCDMDAVVCAGKEGANVHVVKCLFLLESVKFGEAKQRRGCGSRDGGRVDTPTSEAMFHVFCKVSTNAAKLAGLAPCSND